ncbi:hypothetical protein EA187_15925 [Lujinxingia sediminis]|uniref:Uncharacterized protein n=1 Tax=Lujinxingia sediminis TaxID=2480984 RepID=A0ABY0CPN6_9DELT|nr:hypothetical protein [Lujinxingia sediminis]RVU42366.1 hypothetical protein EA187_15925 [Lujinxingia sediminis]
MSCDPGAERRAAAIREVVTAATVERMDAVVEEARAEMRAAGARKEAMAFVGETLTRAVQKGDEASARRLRVKEGLIRLTERWRRARSSTGAGCEASANCPSDAERREADRRAGALGDEVWQRYEQGATDDEIIEWLLQVEDIHMIWTGSSGVMLQLKGSHEVGIHRCDYHNHGPLPDALGGRDEFFNGRSDFAGSQASGREQTPWGSSPRMSDIW